MFLVTEKTVEVETGYICDSCGEIFIKSLSGFHIKHTCGYDSKHDGSTISFQICDNCLMDIVLDRIPKAIIEE